MLLSHAFLGIYGVIYACAYVCHMGANIINVRERTKYFLLKYVKEFGYLRKNI